MAVMFRALHQVESFAALKCGGEFELAGRRWRRFAEERVFHRGERGVFRIGDPEDLPEVRVDRAVVVNDQDAAVAGFLGVFMRLSGWCPPS
jgi:hypothetical protein